MFDVSRHTQAHQKCLMLKIFRLSLLKVFCKGEHNFLVDYMGKRQEVAEGVTHIDDQFYLFKPLYNRFGCRPTVHMS